MLSWHQPENPPRLPDQTLRRTITTHASLQSGIGDLDQRPHGEPVGPVHWGRFPDSLPDFVRFPEEAIVVEREPIPEGRMIGRHETIEAGRHQSFGVLQRRSIGFNAVGR